MYVISDILVNHIIAYHVARAPLWSVSVVVGDAKHCYLS